MNEDRDEDDEDDDAQAVVDDRRKKANEKYDASRDRYQYVDVVDMTKETMRCLLADPINKANWSRIRCGSTDYYRSAERALQRGNLVRMEQIIARFWGPVQKVAANAQ